MFNCCCTPIDSTSFAEVTQESPFNETLGLPSGAEVVSEPIAGDFPEDTFAEDGPRSFTATLEKPDEDTPLGLQMDLTDNALIYVFGLRTGVTPVNAYNDKAPEGEKIRSGDYITKVNGVAGDAKGLMTGEIKKSRSVQIEVRRPVRFEATISKDGKQLGLELNYAERGQMLVIDEIVDGAAKEWGAAHPSMPMAKGDRILSVNGKTGVSKELLEMICKNNPIVLEMSRPSK
mmetsp:Transcript_3875/g.11198  ORF Transcript_3875/g.11198 Transcript_3875/m.11198 type:complete len:232 (-) Transcript_3875:40-735(-)